MLTFCGRESDGEVLHKNKTGVIRCPGKRKGKRKQGKFRRVALLDQEGTTTAKKKRRMKPGKERQERIWKQWETKNALVVKHHKGRKREKAEHVEMARTNPKKGNGKTKFRDTAGKVAPGKQKG